MQLPVDHKWVFVSNSYGMMVKRSHRNHSRCSILRPHVGVIWTYLVEPQFPHCIWPKLTIVPMNQPSTNHQPTTDRISLPWKTAALSLQHQRWWPVWDHKSSLSTVHPMICDNWGIQQPNQQSQHVQMDGHLYIYIYIFMLLGLWMTDINWTNMEQY